MQRAHTDIIGVGCSPPARRGLKYSLEHLSADPPYLRQLALNADELRWIDRQGSLQEGDRGLLFNSRLIIRGGVGQPVAECVSARSSLASDCARACAPLPFSRLASIRGFEAICISPAANAGPK
jgi:hypothetical protein